MPEAEVTRLVDLMHERGGFVTMRESAGEQKPYEINISLMSAFGGEQGFDAYIGAHALLLSLQGTPALYIHSLIGTLNDLDLVEQTGRTRSINRKRWRAADLGPLLEGPSLQQRVLQRMRHLLGRRALQPALSSDAPQEVLTTPSTLMALRRHNATQQLTVFCSVSAQRTELRARDLLLEPGTYTDALSEEDWTLHETVTLAPYEVRWLVTS